MEKRSSMKDSGLSSLFMATEGTAVPEDAQPASPGQPGADAGQETQHAEQTTAATSEVRLGAR